MLGRVTASTGEVSVVHADGGVEVVSAGMSLAIGDDLRAAAGNAVVVLPGGRAVTVLARGRLAFHAASPDGAAGIWLDAAAGSFFVAAAEGAPGSLVIRTPAGTVHAGSAQIALRCDPIDGLFVTATDSGSGAAGLLVENDFGRAELEADGSIRVSGPDEAPRVVDAGSAEPSGAVAASEFVTAAGGPATADGHEVSPGGDMDAVAGDGFAVTAGSPSFDLVPEDSPLQEPAFTGILTRSASIPDLPRNYTEELLLTPQPVTGGASQGPAPIRLTGWDRLGLSWEVAGGAEVTPALTEVGHAPPLRVVSPTDGGSMAMVAAQGDGLGPLDDFLGLSSLQLATAVPGTTPASASAIRATGVTLAAGTTISFDFFFDAANESPRKDFALFTIDGQTFKLADSVGTGVGGATGWRTLVYQVQHTGTYTLGFAAVNDLTTDDPSRLYIDNVQIGRSFDGHWVQVDGSADGTWRTLVQRPTLMEDSLQTSESAAVLTTALTLLANDIDPDPFDQMGIIGIVRTGTQGTVSFNSNGTVTYDPAGAFEGLALGETGTTSFRYQVDAGNGVTDFGTVRVTVTGENDAPTARNADAPNPVAADSAGATIAVLANADDVDSDDDSTTLRVVAAQSASGATVDFTGQPGAGIVYHPGTRFTELAAGERTTDTITYTVEDRHGARATAIERVTIVGVNDAPRAADDLVAGDEDRAVVLRLLSNDSDPDRTDQLSMTAVIVNGSAVQLTVGGAVVLESGASVTLAADGSLSYDPRGRFEALSDGESATDSFRYRIGDGHGGTAEAVATVTIAGRNDVPTAAPDAAAVGEDGAAVYIDALANDGDVDHDGGNGNLRIVAASAASGATVTFDGRPGAGLAYDPGTRFEWLAQGESATDTITYTVEDVHGARATGSVVVTVNGAEDAPIAVDDRATTSEDASIVVSALANDRDPDTSDRPHVSLVAGTPIAPGAAVTLGSGAVVTLTATGELSWNPAGRFDGLALGETATDSFTYGIDDGHGGTAQATITVTIEGRNDAPVARADVGAAVEDGPVVVLFPLANDDDVDSDDSSASLRIVAATAASGAKVTFDGRPGGGLLYDPTGRFQSLGEGQTGSDTITYRVVDSHGAIADGQITLTITGRNDAPVAAADTLMIDANSVLRLPAGALTANDLDVDAGDRLTVVAVDGVAADVGRTITLASGALLVVGADGSVTYDPNHRFDGLTDFQRATDTFTYTVTDLHGATSSAQATVQVQGRNDPPAATADIAFTAADCAVRIPVMINDSDPDAGGNLRVLSLDTTGTLGTVRINADGTLTYDPHGAFGSLAQGQQATDTFQYVLDDYVGGRSTGTVTVTITGNPGAATSQQQLLQSFETIPVPSAAWGALGSVHTAQSYALAGGGAFQATFGSTLAVLTADGASASAIESYLSEDVAVGGRAIVQLPTDAVDHSSPNSGAAMRSIITLGAADVAAGRTTLSFDWNFVSAETHPDLSGLNDYAVFTITDGTTTRVLQLADSRGTSGVSNGWRTSVFDVGSVFGVPTTGTIRVTLGFAVLDDQNPDNSSHLLVDNIRLDRSLGSDYELVASQSGGVFNTYRQAPTAVADSVASIGGAPIDEDHVITISGAGLLAGDVPSAGADAASLRITAVDGATSCALVTLTAGGDVVYDPRGRMDSLAEGESAIDTFRYAVTDRNSGTGYGSVSVTVVGRNDAPVTTADAVSTTEHATPIGIAVLANDDDVDSDDTAGSLRIVGATSTSGAAVSFTGAAGAGLVWDGQIVAAFNALGAGESLVDTVRYTVEDRHGAQSTGTALVTVVGVNDAPTARGDTASTDEDSIAIVAVLGNDSDPDAHDTLSIAAIDGRAVTAGSRVTLASGASVLAGADGRLQYDPGSAFNALGLGKSATDRFSYTVTDGHGGTSQAFVDVSVAGRNDAPVAGADALATAAATRLTVAATALLANDRDPDSGDSLTFVGIDGSGTIGSVSFDGMSVTYDPGTHFRGLGEGETAGDTFTYRLVDQNGASSVGQVTVTVRGVEDPPTAADDVAATDEDTAVTIDVRANDTDPDLHDTLTIQSVDTTGTHGLVTINADGTLSYDPHGQFDALNNGQSAQDTFSYRISDGHGGFDDGTVTVTISGRSDTERLVESFETTISSQNRTSSSATTVTQYVETDGAHGVYNPTDGSRLARLEANGSTASQIETFLGQPSSSLPKDPVDNTFAANGSAIKLAVTVQAGDQISFDWMFDARDATTAPSDGKADDDFAVFSVVGGGASGLFKLADVRSVGDFGASGWRSSVYTATTSGTLTIGFAAVNDRIGGSPTSENSFLLVDNVRLNRDFHSGYQLVDNQENGHFETFVHT